MHLVVLLTLGVGVPFRGAQAQALFTVTDLGTLLGNGSFSEAIGLNNAGQVVGRSTAADGNARAFLWQSGTMTNLGDLGGHYSEAFTINGAGQVVGRSPTADRKDHAFLWENGQMIDLGTLGGNTTWVTGINDAGVVVGWSTTAGDVDRHAFLWQGGSMTDLGTLGGNSSEAVGINRLGQIAGNSAAADGATHAVLWQSGTMTDLGTLGGSASEAAGINDIGQVVGWSFTADGATDAFLWDNGQMTDLGTLGYGGSRARGINDIGQVIGWSTAADGFSHAFLWQHGQMTDLGTLPGGDAWPRQINNAGQVIGSVSFVVFDEDYGDYRYWSEDFLWTSSLGLVPLGAFFSSLDWMTFYPMFFPLQARAINDAGQIVGSGWHSNLLWRAFLLTPVPEGVDETKPTWVNGTLSATSVTSTGATLTWGGAQDDVVVTGYRLLVDGALRSTPAGSPAAIDGLTPATTYTLKVEACDAAGNCSTTGPALALTTPALPPNLVVNALSDPPAGALPGESFAVSDRVDNTGLGPADSSTTRYYLSADPARGTDDRPLAESRAVPALAAGAGSTGTVSVAIPDGTPPGSYVLLACADDLQAVAETSEEDNCRSSAGVVQLGGPDLVAAAVSDPLEFVRPGHSFTVTDSVVNQGAARAGNSITRYYLSTDAVKDSSDRLLTGGRAVPSLAAGARSSGVATVTVPAGIPSGRYRLLACTDDTDAVTETSEVNNCRASAETVRVR